jgi:cell wall-associated NlpC family hydrolase
MRRTLPVLVAAALSLTISADALGAGYATRTLGQGSSGSDVRALQHYLDGAGYNTTADGQFGPATGRSVMAFESAEQRRVNGRASRAEQRIVRARASATQSEPNGEAAPTEKGYLGSDGLAVAPASAPDEVKAIIAAGNAIATKPYKYGGGHARWNDSGYDCSGAMSYALHGAGLVDRPMTSGDYMSWGDAGKGSWITIYARGGHGFLVIAGLRFDTGWNNAGNGPRWSEVMRPTDGYRVRHPAGL